MKKYFVAAASALVAMSFLTAAYADIPDPYGRPRPRPLPRFEVRQQLRAPDLQLRQDKPGEFRLEVTPPGSCLWSYAVQYPDAGEVVRSDEFSIPDPFTVRIGRPVTLKTPGEGRKLRIGVEAVFRPAVFADTRFGPKAEPVGRLPFIVRRSYELERRDGRLELIPVR